MDEVVSMENCAALICSLFLLIDMGVGERGCAYKYLLTVFLLSLTPPLFAEVDDYMFFNIEWQGCFILDGQQSSAQRYFLRSLQQLSVGRT